MRDFFDDNAPLLFAALIFVALIALCGFGFYFSYQFALDCVEAGNQAIDGNCLTPANVPVR